MKKILTIIGARPQIIKSSAISRAIKTHFSEVFSEVVLHTGQHYDENMSDVFFSELEIPYPKYNLKVGSLSHGEQTAKMIEGIEEVLVKEKPQGVIIYGDTNSTLAGAIAASKMLIPVIHIEAGLRSFDKTMPEEINRVVSDHCSTLLFCPSSTGYNNLIREGFNKKIYEKPTINNPNVYLTGDIMYDNTLYFSKKASKRKTPLSIYDDFILCTIHRNSNTDNKENLLEIFSAIKAISENQTIVLPLHPRTKKMLSELLPSFFEEIQSNNNIKIIPPVSFLDMIYLETKAKLIITDSGGVQKEAYFLKKPSVILRPQTEWVEIIECGNALLAGKSYNKIIESTNWFINNPPKAYPNYFGDGQSSKFILDKINKCL
ncbi:MAG: UDP-N-acetylglucosamine 2-epimerase (non-hydrolyzing) [Bacteroidales bacterium]|jgi:UDP-GlcNAc3NAcA epimerase|nr:UDP-N-acetylglucosamine 2-epimerase (non-hydrolyzing) [Bacteroidales bacterium]